MILTQCDDLGAIVLQGIPCSPAGTVRKVAIMSDQAIRVRIDDNLGRALRIRIPIDGEIADLSIPTLDYASRTKAREATIAFAREHTKGHEDDLFELMLNSEQQGMLLDRDELLALIPIVLNGDS